MARAARKTPEVQEAATTLTADVSAETPAGTWEWEPADPSEVPSDPTPAPDSAAVLDVSLDAYLNLALIGIAGVALAMLLTRSRR